MRTTTQRLRWGLSLLVCLSAFLAASFATAQSVDVYLTTGDQSVLLQQQASLTFGANSSGGKTVISVDDQITYQSLDGFGFALTQGSAEALSALSSSTRANLLQELFDPVAGNGISVVRISIGASDLSNGVYSYNETSGDVSMTNFSLAGPDQTYLIPLLQDILAINPNIKVLATPWTAPTWMKDNNTWIGGRLETQYYAAYALYFTKYLDAMSAQGIDIWAITPQNEPENPWNEPSMEMDATEQTNFINGHLGPAIASSGHATKIIAFDHNCDNTSYPTQVLNNSSYVDGAAFHLYGGNISAMSTVHNNTGKNVYFTEQYTDINGSFSSDLGWHMQNVVIGSIRNWSKTVIEWNLASDSNFGPRTPGGCTDCLGAITVQGSNSFQRNVSYYIISQVSRFVQPGAVRIESNTNTTIQAVAFQNPDGSKVVLAYNSNGRNKDLKVDYQGQSFVYTMPGHSAATFVWGNGGSTPQPPAAPSNLSASANATNELGLSWADNANNESGFTLQRSPDGSSSWSTIANLGGNTTNYTDGGLTESTTYYYRVRAENSEGSSAWSNVASGTTDDPTPPVVGLVSGQVYRITNRASGRAMDVEGVSLDNGARLQTWEWSGSGGENQKFTLTDHGNGLWSISPVHSGKVLDVVGAATASNTEIQQWDDFGSANQRFWINNLGNGHYQIVASHSGLVLGLGSGSTRNGAKVKQLLSNGDTKQEWAIEAVSNLRGGLTAEVQTTPTALQLFPNPATHHLSIALGTETLTAIRVYTATGAEVAVPYQSAAYGAELQVGSLPVGLYRVVVVTSHGRYSRSFVKE